MQFTGLYPIETSIENKIILKKRMNWIVCAAGLWPTADKINEQN